MIFVIVYLMFIFCCVKLEGLGWGGIMVWEFIVCWNVVLISIYFDVYIDIFLVGYFEKVIKYFVYKEEFFYCNFKC